MSRTLEINIERRYSSETIIRAEISVPLDAGRVTVLFGPSGCGKTTVLRSVAGLDVPHSGSITFNGSVWFDRNKRVFLPPQSRGIGFLFQEYALFPHLTVAENVGYALRRLAAGDRQKRVAELLVQFQLQGLENRLPRQISGGQQQRVALARTIAPQPRLMLLDEPLSALDATMRAQLRTELKSLLTEFAIPSIVVTHDPEEVAVLADYLVVMEAGRVKEQRTLRDSEDQRRLNLTSRCPP